MATETLKQIKVVKNGVETVFTIPDDTQALADRPTTEQVQEMLQGYATSEHTHDFTAVLEPYYTKTQIDEIIANLPAGDGGGSNVTIGEDGTLIITAADGSTTTAPVTGSFGLTEDKTLYVDTELGTDVGDGRGYGAGSFRTLEYAINSLPKFMNGFDATIKVKATSITNLNISGFIGGTLKIEFEEEEGYNNEIRGVLTMENCHGYVIISGATLNGAGLMILNSHSLTINNCNFLSTFLSASNSRVAFSNCVLDSTSTLGVIDSDITVSNTATADGYTWNSRSLTASTLRYDSEVVKEGSTTTLTNGSQILVNTTA